MGRVLRRARLRQALIVRERFLMEAIESYRYSNMYVYITVQYAHKQALSRALEWCFTELNLFMLCCRGEEAAEHKFCVSMNQIRSGQFDPLGRKMF